MISNKESGVAIWYILVAVVLFAALSFSFVKSSSNTQATMSKEQAQITASEILRYAKSIELAVQRLITVNGCSENEISFYSTEWSTPANYDNPSSLFANGDFNCHVFQRDGGGIQWDKVNINGAPVEYIYTGRLRITDIEDNNQAELLIILPDINLEVCKAINKVLDSGFANNPPSDAANANYAGFYFTGSFLVGNQLNGEVTGHATGCFEGDVSPPSGTYHFFHTLIAR